MFGKKGTSKKVRLVVDVGASSVGAALVHSGVEKPELSFVKRTLLNTGGTLSQEQLLSKTQGALQVLLKDYANHTVTDIDVVLSLPWYHRTIRNLQSSFEKETTLSRKTVHTLIEKYKNEKPPESGRVDFEVAAIQVWANGYATTLDHAVDATSLRINLYESEIEQQVLNAFTQTIQQIFPKGNPIFHSAPLVIATTLRDISDKTSFISLHIGGQTTEMAVMHQHGVYHFSNIPVGYRHVAQGVQPESESNSPEIGSTLSSLALFARGELHDEKETQLKSSLEEATKKLEQPIQEGLHQAADTVPIPRTAFVVVNEPSASWVSQVLQMKSSQGIAPQLVDASLMQKYIAIGEGATYDSVLSLATLFLTSSEEDIVTSSE